MANTLLTISMITREALRVLENNLTFTTKVNRQYDDKFGVEGAKIGTVLNVRKPPRYVGREGQALSIESAVETQVPVTLNHQFGVDIQFSSQDLALSIDDFSDRFLKPAVSTVANKMDYDGFQLYKKVANTVGVFHTVPTALLTYLQAGVKLDDNSCPIDGDRFAVLNPLMQATIVNALTAFLNPVPEISRQYRRGEMGEAAGFTWAMDQNVPVHSIGQLGGTPIVTVANQTGSSILTSAWTSAAANRLKEGDIVQIAGVFGVNPQSRQTTGALQDFTITADADSNGSGLLTMPIYPPIVTAGAFQTVTASPAASALISVFSTAAAGQAAMVALATSPQGLAFHRDAFTLASADLPLPRGVDMAARMSDKQLGVSMRLVRAYDISTDNFPCRLDVLYGWASLRPELACRVCS
jgi:hypothetical protein